MAQFASDYATKGSKYLDFFNSRKSIIRSSKFSINLNRYVYVYVYRTLLHLYVLT